MKTSTLKTLFVTLVLALISVSTQAQLLTSVRIDVQGSRYSDQMWVFSVPICTRDFDNGWDGYKMYGTSLAPQIFGMEPNGNFQIDAVPTFENTYIGFWAGEDTTYTFRFNNENLSLRYTQLYMIDSVANKVVDIFATGTKYTFSVKPTAAPVKRFKFVTTNPTVVVIPPVVVPVDTVVVIPPVVVPVDTVVVIPPVIVPVDTVVVIPPVVVVPPVVTDSVVIPDPKSADTKDTKGTKDTKAGKDTKDKKDKKMTVTNRKDVLVVDNPGIKRGKVSVYNASSGKKAKDFDFNAAAITNIKLNLPRGTYAVKAVTNAEQVSTNIIIQ